MDEIVSPTIFIYGLAFILGVGKACKLLIWPTLPKPRPGLRQEVREAWHRRNRRRSLEKTNEHPLGTEGTFTFVAIHEHGKPRMLPNSGQG